MYAVYDTSEYNENHILYLKEIRYTGNIVTGQGANQWVRFHYDKRDDAYVSKAPGFIMSMGRILDRIEIGWDDPDSMLSGEKTLWDYEMVYETSEDSKRPLLETVKSSRTSTQPEFIYQPAEHSLVWKNVNNPHAYDYKIDPGAIKYFEGDFNGDGISDIVFFNPETGYWRGVEATRDGSYTYPVYGNRFKGYDSDKKIQFFKGGVTGDYNGDGRTDIAFYLPETKSFWVAEHNGETFDFKHYGTLYLTDIDIFKCEWFPGDYDGNGLSDTVLFNEATGEWILMTNEGGRFEFVKFSKHFKNLFRSDYSPNSNLDSESTFDDSEYGKDRDKVNFLSGDYNGDGRTDISVYDGRTGRWYVGANYRKDGSVPFELEWTLYKEFAVHEEALFSHHRFSGDFNGDGLSDFLVFNRDNGEFWLGETGDNTIQFRMFSKVPDNKDITRWIQGDFNGDGRTDIGFYSKTDKKFWVGEADPQGFRYRAYADIYYGGPDPEKILRAPLPKDEVDLKNSTGIAMNSGKVESLKYKYDGNFRADRGEKIFAGNYSGNSSEILVFNKDKNSSDRWYSFTPDSNGKSSSKKTEHALGGIDLTDARNRVLKTSRGSLSENDSIFFYTSGEVSASTALT